MFGSRKWTRIALALNLAGTVLLFFSFQATSSSFRLIQRTVGTGIFQTEHEYDICVEDYTLLVTDAHSGVGFGHPGCAVAENDRRVAVVNTEHPSLVTLGFLLITLGFIIQFFAVPEPKTIAELRKEIKLLKIKEKANTRR